MGTQSTSRPFRHAPLCLWTALAFLSLLHASGQTTITATSIPLILPSAIAFDSAGNLYIAEAGNHCIRRVDPQGRMSMIAGTATQGFSGDGGKGTAAQLDSPQGLVVSGTVLYIADTHNHRIRKLDLTTGDIGTFAGTGTPGFSGDSATAALANFDLPTALATDIAGDLYVADTGNHRIRRIAATTGIITTVAGSGIQGYSGDSGTAAAAAIDSPSGLAVDTAGNIYLADTRNHRIRKINAATGTITTLAGNGALGSSGDGSTATASALALPHDLTVDGLGNLYFADTENHRIRRIDATTGVITTVAGSGAQGFWGESGPATIAGLDSPRAVILSPTSQLTLADTNNQRIRQLNATLTTIAGLGNTTPGVLTLTAPSVIAYGTGQLTATLATPTTAIGSITFLDVSSGTAQTNLGAAPLAANSASLPLTTLNAGTHTITATYAGDLTHGSAQSAAFTLTVTPAPTLTSLALSSSQSLPITVTVHVVSTTTGKPTGSLTILDSATPVTTATLSQTGAATALIPTLAPGLHTITAAYSGDTDFQPSSSVPVSFTIMVPIVPDFSLAVVGSSAITVPSGNAATFNFATQTAGPLNSPITLNVSGLPIGAVVAFSPAYLPPGASTNTFALTITTVKAATSSNMLLSVAILLPPLWRRKRRSPGKTRAIASGLVVALLPLVTLAITACGDRIAVNPQTGTTAQTYAITVTGTATSPTGDPIVHATVVTLTVQ